MVRWLAILLFAIGSLLVSLACASPNKASALDKTGLFTQPAYSVFPRQQGHEPQPFHFHYSASGSQIHLRWDIKPGHYLYRSRLNISLTHSPQAYIGPIALPKGILRNDPFFGRQIMYKNKLNIDITLYGHLSPNAQLNVRYQGCSDNLCFAPTTQTIALTSLGLSPRTTPPTAQTISTPWLKNGIFWALLSLFGLGILLSFTPCVLPMLPILSGIIINQRQPKFWKSLTLSLSYVLGMALTYTALGLIISHFGATVQAWFQQPVFITAFALIFVLLALSMFGTFTLTLPSTLHSRLNQFGQKLPTGNVLGVFVLGALSTLILSPCTSAPLIGVLTFILQTGNQAFGALALFVLALGMGLPLVIISIGLGKWLPKAGAWMQQIKVLLGVMLLAVALLLLSRIIAREATLFLGGLLSLTYGAYLFPFKKTIALSQRLQRVIGWVLIVYGTALIVGSLMGSTNPFQPLAPLTRHSVPSHEQLHFTRVNNLNDLNAQLALATAQHKTAFVDFYANWCLECHKLAATTFKDPDILRTLRHYALIQVDISKSSPATSTLMQHFHLLGVPTLMTFAPGTDQPSMRLSGYVSAAQLNKSLTP